MDTGHVVARLVARHGLAVTHRGGRAAAEPVRQIVRSRYQVFVERIAAAVQAAHGARGADIHRVDMDDLAGRLATIGGSKRCVSLHPFIELDSRSLRISRLFELGGRTALGYAGSPGSPPVKDQVRDIGARVGRGPITLLDDDCFSNRFLPYVIDLLDAAGVAVEGIAVGVLVDPCAAEGFRERGVELTALVDLSDVEVYDLCDTRDFLLGGDGTVVRFPGGATGRVPYVLPFVRLTDLLRMSTEDEVEFSQRILRANIEFFSCLESSGIEFRLSHIDAAFGAYLVDLLGCPGDEPLVRIASRLLDLGARRGRRSVGDVRRTSCG
ncbi:MAG TPA: hypothetical protein VIP77_12620 [Jiangellaceae bacterium]